MKTHKCYLIQLDVYVPNKILILKQLYAACPFSIYSIIDLTAIFRLDLNQYMWSEKISDHLNGKLKNKLNMSDVFVLRYLFNGKYDKNRRNLFDMFRVEQKLLLDQNISNSRLSNDKSYIGSCSLLLLLIFFVITYIVINQICTNSTPII